MRFGIGITTRNRPKTLAKCLESFHHFGLDDTRIVVVDDCSDEEYGIKDVVDAHPDVMYRKSHSRMGIAGAKNACLYALQDCDHVFLFDDDAWPTKEGWQDNWVKCSEEHGIGHSMYLYNLYGIDERHPIKPLGRKGSGDTAIIYWNNCLGVALHFSRECLSALGGYDYESVKHFYGFEHVQMSRRAKEAGFTAGYDYVSPSNIHEYVYSQDVDYMTRLTMDPPPLGRVDAEMSLTRQEKHQHNLNIHLLTSMRRYILLSDPICMDEAPKCD
jgi:glycosyltransferase involved in cell wall biosynthesis